MSKMLLLGGSVALLAIALAVFQFQQKPASSTTTQESSEKFDVLELQTWHEFTPPSGKFKVLFPSLPQHAQEKLGDPKTKEPRQYDMYVSEKDNGTLFMISLITLLDTNKKKLDESMLSGIIDNMLSASPNSKVKNMRMGSYRDYPSIDFSVQNEQVNIDGKAFLVNNTLYILTAISKLSNYHREEFDFFINSFQLTPPKISEMHSTK